MLNSAAPTRIPGDTLFIDHTLPVPLDHANPDGPQISIFVREAVRASKADDKEKKLPYLLFLQGGPGFGAGGVGTLDSGWRKAALDNHRVLLLDQRGTGRSTPASVEAIRAIGAPQAQADYLSHFRADAIVRDCELVRARLCGGAKLTLLGQSYGGFCILTYLSLFPEGAIERSLFTFGLAPVGAPTTPSSPRTCGGCSDGSARSRDAYHAGDEGATSESGNPVLSAPLDHAVLPAVLATLAEPETAHQLCCRLVLSAPLADALQELVQAPLRRRVCARRHAVCEPELHHEEGPVQSREPRRLRTACCLLAAQRVQAARQLRQRARDVYC